MRKLQASALLRRFIAPPFWVLRYEIAGNGGLFVSESGEWPLDSDVRDRDAADLEAREYLERTAIVAGECRYKITVRPWWMRLRLPVQEAGGIIRRKL